MYLPFGLRVGKRSTNLKLLPKVIQEIARVLRPDVGRALLLCYHSDDVILQAALAASLEEVFRRCVNIGGLLATLFLFRRRAANCHISLNNNELVGVQGDVLKPAPESHSKRKLDAL
mmetsp:Transcript_41725/g.56882  ORF Transcript_41725/g.56882 Transcript_41725/m.56882 type:complete len:117 (-) Transcript_41725:177-527(-)